MPINRQQMFDTAVAHLIAPAMMFRRLIAAGLVAGHGLIHVTLPFLDIAIHGVALLIFIWSFRHVPAR